jgi:hypothetical protein
MTRLMQTYVGIVSKEILALPKSRFMLIELLEGSFSLSEINEL